MSTLSELLLSHPLLHGLRDLELLLWSSLLELERYSMTTMILLATFVGPSTGAGLLEDFERMTLSGFRECLRLFKVQYQLTF